jgi:hypothetical protein
MEGVIARSGGSGGALLPAISAVAQAVAQAPQARVESISMRGNVVDLRLSAPTVEAIDAIKQSIAASGIAAELQSATPRGQTVEGRLQLRMGPA